MFNLVNTWQFNVVAYLLCVVIFAPFYKLAVRNAKNDGAVTAMLQMMAGLILLLISPLFKYNFSISLRTVILLLVSCIFYAINDRLQTTSRKHIEVSLISIIGELSSVFLIIIGLLVFHESISPLKMVGGVLILLSNFIVLYKGNKFEINKYIVMGILSTIAYAIAVSIDIGISPQFNLPIYIAITLIVPSMFILAAERIKPSELLTEYKLSNKKYCWLMSLSWGLLIIFSLRSFQLGKITTIVPLQAVGIFLNVLLSYIFMNEKKDPLKKIVASILIIAGVYLTVI
ncbi:DMT family transporter [candidate division WWE3 bacterium]|uniref:DMT family transporter n=1 Tax=candidate division WWE3 bacterium TaxID=2053526 RepID=A0A7X9E6Z0_UNCKA|nr:DMT family transporter [candidate division WWE3 bacterium]